MAELFPRLGDRLLAAGLITNDQLKQALAHQRIHGLRLGECFYELGFAAERELLMHLAAALQLRFVLSEKLAALTIPERALDAIPVRVAERQSILPVAYSAEQGALTVVATSPQDPELTQELADLAGVKQVNVLLGMRPVIHAAIRQHYYKEPARLRALIAGDRASSATLPELDVGASEDDGLGSTVVRKRPAPTDAATQVSAAPAAPSNAVVEAAVAGLTADGAKDVHEIAARILAALAATSPAAEMKGQIANAYKLAREFIAQRSTLAGR